MGCTSLTNVTLSECMTEIKDATFWNCENLADIVIPKGITRLCRAVFGGCKSLKNITIPEEVAEIDGEAFYLIEKNITLSGYKGSRAESFAAENNIKFVALDNEPVTTTAVPGTTTTVSGTTTAASGTTTTTKADPVRPVKVAVYGDTNLDGEADIGDVVLACRFIVGDTTAVIKDAGVASADVDGDGQVTPTDTTLMLQKIAKIITEFPAAKKNA